MNRPSPAVPFAFAALVALAALGCSNSLEDEGLGGECKTGANAAWATPAGTAFALPAGVSLVGEISGNVNEGPCATETPIEYGGDLLPACLTFENKTAAAITVKLPAGLVFLARDFDTQNGIILQEHDLVVPAGQTKSFRFALYCLNEHCLFGTKSTVFTFGNVTNDPAMLELIGLARGRKMQSSAINTASVFGRAVWDITGGLGLSDDRKSVIAGMRDGS